MSMFKGKDPVTVNGVAVSGMCGAGRNAHDKFIEALDGDTSEKRIKDVAFSMASISHMEGFLAGLEAAGLIDVNTSNNMAAALSLMEASGAIRAAAFSKTLEQTTEYHSMMLDKLNMPSTGTDDVKTTTDKSNLN